MVVTGGGTGIGLATARAFVARGAQVLICGRRKEVLERSAAEIAAEAILAGAGVIATMTADVVRPEDMEAVGDEAVRRWRRLDVWINNAGRSERATFPDAGPEHVARILAVNVTGTVNGCRAAVRRMRGHGGAVVNVASYLAHHAGASASLPVYAASKGAVTALTRSLAVKHGPEGIRVNAVLPALVLTGFNRELWEGHDDLLARARELGERYPLGRCGLPEDVANAILFLAGDEAGWITGQELVVDGGVSAL